MGLVRDTLLACIDTINQENTIANTPAPNIKRIEKSMRSAKKLRYAFAEIYDRGNARVNAPITG